MGSVAVQSDPITIGGGLLEDIKLPQISGRLEEGRDAMCSPGEWTGDPSYAYLWLRDGVSLGAAPSTPSWPQTSGTRFPAK